MGSMHIRLIEGIDIDQNGMIVEKFQQGDVPRDF